MCNSSYILNGNYLNLFMLAYYHCRVSVLQQFDQAIFEGVIVFFDSDYFI